MNTDSPLDDWFLNEIFNKSVAVDLREITAKGEHQPESTMYLWQLQKAIELYCHKQVIEARDSEQNRLFAILRHLGVKHDAKEIMRVRKEWDNLAEAELRKTL